MPEGADRMIASCSACSVATMSLHPAGSRGVHRGQQGRLPGQAGGAGEFLAVKHLVIQAGHPAAAHDDVAAAPDTVRRVRGGHVEGAGRRGTPVEQERLAVIGLIPQADPPDVQAFAGPQVEPAEAHSVLRRVQPGQLPGVPRDRGVPVEPGLRRAAIFPQCQREPRRRLVAQRVDPLVEAGDVLPAHG